MVGALGPVYPSEAALFISIGKQTVSRVSNVSSTVIHVCSLAEFVISVLLSRLDTIPPCRHSATWATPSDAPAAPTWACRPSSPGRRYSSRSGSSTPMPEPGSVLVIVRRIHAVYPGEADPTCDRGPERTARVGVARARSVSLPAPLLVPLCDASGERIGVRSV